MIDGLYKVTFATTNGSGVGIVHLAGGRLWGGDWGMFYVGTYAVDRGKFTASVKTDRHSATPGAMSVFMIDRVDISLTGTISGDVIDAHGQAAQAPGVPFSVVLNRLSD